MLRERAQELLGAGLGGSGWTPAARPADDGHAARPADIAADPQGHERRRDHAPAALATEHLGVRFGDVLALEDVTLTVPAGTFCGILGPNGAGKSTLLKAALGLVRASAGTIRLAGEAPAAARRHAAYVPQRAAVDWDFPASALDVVAMGFHAEVGLFRRLGRRHWEEARAFLGEVGLADLADRPIGALSGGQQQRVFLARALARKASVILLDEPLAGVDAVTEEIVIAVLRARVAAGATVLMVHHDLDTAAAIFDHAVLVRTRLVAAGPTEAVLTRAHLAAAYGRVLAGAAERPAS